MAHPKDGLYKSNREALDAYDFGRLNEGHDENHASGKTKKGIVVWLPIVESPDSEHNNIVCGDYIIEEAKNPKKPNDDKQAEFYSGHQTIIRKGTQGNWNCEYLGEYEIIYANPTWRVTIHAKKKPAHYNCQHN